MCFTELVEEIEKLDIGREYEIKDWLVQGKYFVLKICLESYGSFFIEGQAHEIIEELSGLATDLNEARFECPACHEKYMLNHDLWTIASCSCATNFRFARTYSSSYNGANRYAAFDAWTWLINEVRERTSHDDEATTYIKALNSTVSVDELFDGAFVANVPMSDYPCFAVSAFVRPKPFASLSPEACYHLALWSLTDDVHCRVSEHFGYKQHEI